MRRRFASALAVAALAATAGCGSHTLPSGPIERSDPHGWEMGDFPVGSVVTDGGETVVIRGRQPAVLDDVQLVGAQGLRLVGVKMTKTGQRGLVIMQVRGFPPRWDTLPPEVRRQVDEQALGPAIGATMQPKATPAYELYIGMRITRPGPVTRRGIRIDYHIGDQHYSYVDPASVRICTTTGAYHWRGDCPSRKG